MRYYSIVITDQDGKLVTLPSSIPGTNATYTSFANNRSLPGALQIELDIPLAAYATPLGDSIIRIWGISLAEISAATQLNPYQSVASGALIYKNIAVYGGMKAGLPLANPNQIGLLAQGTITQAFGNWIGTEQSLDLIIAPDFGSNAVPKNLTFNWKAGTSLEQAVRTTLATAFPKIKPQFSISSDLVLNHDEPGFYRTLEQFAAYVKQVSRSIIGGDYQGVDIFLNNGTFYVFDSTTPTTPIAIKFQDLIGQPTWIEGTTIQFKTVMRGDISIGNFIKLPPALVTTTSASSSSLVNLKSVFQGNFQVSETRHLGSFRQPTADAWVTVFNAFPVPQSNAA